MSLVESQVAARLQQEENQKIKETQSIPSLAADDEVSNGAFRHCSSPSLTISDEKIAKILQEEERRHYGQNQAARKELTAAEMVRFPPLPWPPPLHSLF